MTKPHRVDPIVAERAASLAGRVRQEHPNPESETRMGIRGRQPLPCDCGHRFAADPQDYHLPTCRFRLSQTCAVGRRVKRSDNLGDLDWSAPCRAAVFDMLPLDPPLAFCEPHWHPIFEHLYHELVARRGLGTGEGVVRVTMLDVLVDPMRQWATSRGLALERIPDSPDPHTFILVPGSLGDE